MSSNDEKSESKVEAAKRASRRLRGTIKETLASESDHFVHDDVQLLKFHGAYQQDDRDSRKKRRAEGKGKEYTFMARVAIPGGIMTSEQYLGLDQIADELANGTLRITTRQGIQFHGVVKGHLKKAIAGINQRLLTTLSACGDVERNVMACPAPLDDEGHVTLRRVAREIAKQLRPATQAYHEIWLNGEKHSSTEESEPFYGDTYLPRKFKTGIALDNDNCIDVFNNDAGLIAIMERGRLQGFNVVVGGGMGMTHSMGDTFAHLAEPLGFVESTDAVEAIKTIVGIFRDHGNRTDRKHARIKYLIADWGMDRFAEEFRRRVGFELKSYRALPRLPVHDHLGRHRQSDGKWFYGLFVENGRIADTEGCRLRTALRKIVAKHRPGVRNTPQQSVLLTDIDEAALADIESVLRDHGVKTVEELSAARRYSMACPALPTCGLALSESERVMPSVIDRLEEELESLGLADEPLTIRKTGCPNGCARPYTADLSFVGKGPENYNVYLGGALSGDRVVDLFADDIAPADFVEVLRPLFQAWAAQRRPDEGLGDFYQRLMGDRPTRVSITGVEEPTRSRLSLPVLR